jgi:dipeptidyl aminopeptidase/acylaminoacyl peptidase
MGGTIEQIPDVYRAASPITYVDQVTAPMFITSGENDPRCPVRQVDTYVQRLQDRGHDVHYERLAPPAVAHRGASPNRGCHSRWS